MTDFLDHETVSPDNPLMEYPNETNFSNTRARRLPIQQPSIGSRPNYPREVLLFNNVY